MVRLAGQIGWLARTFLRKREGATVCEYAVLLAAGALTAAVAISVVGNHVAGTAASVSTVLPVATDFQHQGASSYVRSQVTTATP